MAEIWEQNEQKNEEEDLVVTEHRDNSEPNVTADDEESVETTTDDPREALEVLGEDVSSSPARRGSETSD